MKVTFQILLISLFITVTHQASLKSNTLKSKTKEVEETVTFSHDLVVSMMNNRNRSQNSRKISSFSRKTTNDSFQSARIAIPAMFFVRSRGQFADQISNDVDSVHNFLSSRRNRQRTKQIDRKSAFSRLNRNNLDFIKFLQNGEFSR